MKKILWAVLCITASAFGEVRWQDEKGTKFLVLDGAMTHSEAWKACANRGWDVFNFEYLDAEAQSRFLAAPELAALAWTKQFAGEPGERLVVSIWGTSEVGTIVTHGSSGRSVSGLSLQRHADEKDVRHKIDWGQRFEGKRSAVCMYQSHTWEGCSHELVCKHEQPNGGTYAWRYSLYEYGPTRAVVLKRLNERAKNWPHDIGGKCELAIKDPYCLDYRAAKKEQR